MNGTRIGDELCNAFGNRREEGPNQPHNAFIVHLVLAHNAFGLVPSDGLAIHPCNSAARACLGASSRKVL